MSRFPWISLYVSMVLFLRISVHPGFRNIFILLTTLCFIVHPAEILLSQTYSAILRMQFLSVSMRKDWHPKLKDWTRRTLLAASIAVTAYIADVQANISAIVQPIIDEGLSSNIPDDIEGARERKRYLAVWSRAEFPLGYGEHIYPALLRCLAPPGGTPALAWGNKKSMSTLELASLICDMVRPIRPIALQAPLIAKSRSLTIFRVAIPYMYAQAKHNGAPDPSAFVTYALAQIFDEQHVAHVPWSAPQPTNAVGRPARKVDFSFWRRTSKSEEVGHRALMKVVDAQEHTALSDEHIARQIALKDAKAPWAIHPMTIGELPSILQKVILPTDFNRAHASLSPDDGYISATYDWLFTHYDGAKPVHRFALIVSHMFSRMAPNLGHPPMPPSVLILRGKSAQITAAVRRSPWTFDPRRGVTATEPFITMLTTAIIALSDDTSPLRRHMRKNGNSLGDWSSKHGASSTSMAHIALVLTCDSSSGNKLINAFNLVRIGVADAHAPAIYKSPKYGYSDSWTMKPAHELAAFANRFLALLKATPYGPYEATKLVFGTSAADSLATDSFTGVAQFAAPRPVQQPPAKRSRPSPTNSDDEAEVEESITRPSPRKRARQRR